MPYSWVSWRRFLNFGSFLSDDSSICQIDPRNQPEQGMLRDVWIKLRCEKKNVASERMVAIENRKEFNTQGTQNPPRPRCKGATSKQGSLYGVIYTNSYIKNTS